MSTIEQPSWFLHTLGVATYWGKWKIELKILEQLSRISAQANVYELKWKRLRGVDTHYSTVLRALRRLEEKKLVRVVSSNKVGRRHVIYDCTLLGELIVAIAKNGWRAAVAIVAESSPSFRECVGAHLSFNPDYHFSLTQETIREIWESKRGEMVTRSDLDFYVRNIELRWVRENIIENLNDLSSRPMILKYLGKIIQINWISDWVIQSLEKYFQREHEWIRTLEDFKSEVKRLRFLLGRTQR